MNKIEQIKIPVRLSDSDGNSDAVISVVREMFSNDDPEISIEWLDEFGDIDSCCYYDDLTLSDRQIVDAAILDYDQNMVRKTRAAD